jgi:DtxR family Mn-dependent transcriptional regulator
MATESTEMYLQAVYRLTREAEHTTVSDIASALGLRLPSVSEKVKSMVERGLLEHQWRGAVSLSEEGKKAALVVLRKRRLIETFLVELAGYGFDEVHEEACRLEHVVSDRLADSIEKILGFPRKDPHGHPIPDRDGVLNQKSSVPLSLIPAGKSVRVVELYGMDPQRLHYLKQLGLRPQIVFRVIEVAPFEGPYTIETEQRSISIARSMASLIGVELVEQETTDE